MSNAQTPNQDNPFKKPAPAFRPLNVHILTVTDTRSAKEDGSGNYLAQAVQDGEHVLHSRDWVRDELYDIRACVSVAIANPEINVVLITVAQVCFRVM